jgi:predicted Zn-dependent peptidase
MKSCFLIFSFFLLFCTPVYAFECKECTLANGMKVCLVKTSFEKQSMCLELFALGGTASLPKEDRPSGFLAAPLVSESGIGELSGDALFSHLYKHGIELGINIKSFDRSLTIHAPAPELTRCLQLAKDVFTRPRFDTLALQRAQSNAKELINEARNNPNLASKEFFLGVNMQHWDRISSLTEEDLSNVDIKKAQHFFEQNFSNPRDFTCVIVGDIDIETTKSLLESSLGSIILKTIPATSKPTSSPAFPKGIVWENKNLLENTSQAITQITFPIPHNRHISPDLIDRLRDSCELIHAHLGVTFKNSAILSPRIQVKYEFPNFPLIDHSWLLIAFASDPSDVESLNRKILSALEELRRNGPSEELMANLSSNKSKQDDCWSEDNGILLTLIANIYRWGWNLKTIDRYIPNPSAPRPAIVSTQAICRDLQLFLPVDQYSVLTAYPINSKEISHD